MASVQCLVPSGDLPIEFKWLFNGKPLISYDSVSTTKMGKRRSVLTIESVNGNHAGNYTCQVSNIAEIVNFTANLIVNGLFFIFKFIGRLLLYLNIFFLISPFTLYRS